MGNAESKPESDTHDNQDPDTNGEDGAAGTVGTAAGAAAVGTAAGATAGGAVAACVVPVVNAIGFTANGIVAGSAAAGMMSSAAVASGGGVAAGSMVATLQSVGAVGLAGGIVAGIVGGGALLGGGGVAIYKCFRSGQQEYLSAYTNEAPPHYTLWVIATEEGSGNVRVCRYKDEAAALDAFNRIWCARLLYNPKREEVAHAGMGLAWGTIRRVMAEHYFAQ